MKRFFFMTIGFLCLSCSNNSDDANTTTLTLPETIALAYSTGEEVRYEFDYNSDNQITSIAMQRNSDGDESNIVSNFTYGGNGNLLQVVTTGEGLETEILLSYDINNIITNVDYDFDGTTYDSDIFYHGEVTNSYAMNGDFPYMPMGWDFDEANRLEMALIASNFYTPTYGTTHKGIYSDVNLQPALHVWNKLTLFIAPWELCFFSERDIESLTINEDVFRYKNKLRDGQGNLIAFQFAPQVPSGFTLDYTITYETNINKF